ncbi:TonB-linked SusC/RagA family outer membrane protein [Parabacteroides sp. PF5-5]|uniref:SusC/RagA family TonB-linked outer membrane protein n=1 Tax=unclassified Parabacteroides TaxID=2649774 RepID=UPI0024747147|nr:MULTISPECIES: SusC/RagA family TonB-linked outer membrane protein [unclassified Parabacteroides]MDH6304731.1 TonB-linked SusC/RagA family outer membrane protein [Parabacteroides sp. PH5-39]MDH6315654.1 TonB-linked SusC/RagA family outer membrane protein [Parabacteroides sp. PF5-13]MDH6319315.1 TonB-linked SusC/RagA family outer membrane protein [Parabacteroides sp. PH5-13]MDH6323046.1 TonB-linked SusC/RagA family outer membrane protein [Parabacteroides sp. PH5-8]MDH6326847.1 TonB-linked Sus
MNKKLKTISPFPEKGKVMRALGSALLFLFISTSVFSQVTVRVKQQTIKQALRTIERSTDYRFFYSNQLPDLDRTVSFEVNNQSIDVVLGNLLKETGLIYEKRENNQIYLSVRKQFETDTKKNITGTVTDEHGEPVIGANVVEKGTTNGVITNMDGEFLFSVSENGILQISYIGYLNQEIQIKGQTDFQITLKEDSRTLDEVVVVGYGTQKKVNMTGAITAIKTSELSNISATNLSNTLAGRAPGVNIVGNSGLIGSSSTIRMRGGFGEPLFVIDGIVRDKDAFDALEANEIDQLSFLKDAATASIYGSQAGNGVVLVTTKTGDSLSKPTFRYQGSYTFMNPTQELFSDKFTAVDELIYQNRVAEYKGNAIPNGEKEFEYFKDRNYNVNDYIWQNPWNTKHSIDVSGGSERITYYALFSYIGEEGSYKSLENDKFNLRSNVTAKITNWIKMNLNISANQQNQKRFYWPFVGDDDQNVSDLYRCTFNWPKTYPFYLDADGTPADHITNYPVQTPMGSWQAWSVIDQVLGDRYIKTRKREMNAILSLDIDLSSLIPGLSTKFAANYIGNDMMRKKFLTFQENYVWAPLNASDNRFIPAPPDLNKTNIFTFGQSQEFLSYDVHSLWSEQLNWFLNYNNSFGKHDVAATVVWEQASNGGEKVHAKAENPLTNFDQMFVYSTDTERRYGNANEVNGGRLSWIGRFNYMYAQKYIAEFSFRYDGNSLFPKSKRWGFFPSVSAAWRISEENFMASTRDWLDNLKIRASYGTTGNDLNVDNKRISPFSYINSYVSGTSYIWGNNQNLGIKPGATPNPYLTWVTSKTYNGGLDFAVLQNRLSGSFDAFYRKESDILGSRIVTIPDNYGQELAPENYAERSWRGWEFNAMWRDKALNGEINYSVYGNIGYSKDKWDKLDESATYLSGGGLESLSKVGKPLNMLTGYKTLGMVRTQEQLDELLAKGFKQFGRDPYLGGLYFEDIRGDGYSDGPDGKIDGNDIQLLSKNGSPRINYGFGGSITWKGITIDAHFQGVGMYDRMVSNSDGPGIRQHGGTERPYYPIWTDDVWTPENPNAKYPRVIGNNWYESGTGEQSFWIKNGAYLRLKNLNIGYQLPKNLISFIGLIDAQIFFNGSNLFVISPMNKYHDPEQQCYDSYPLMKSFTFGLDIKF